MTINIDFGSPQIKACFFDRHGGVSEQDYQSLNSSFLVGDNPVHVEENRRRIAAYFGQKADRLVFLHQVHSAYVMDAKLAQNMAEPPQADALVSHEKGVVLAIQTADCLPILCADAHNQIIGAIHAGWRGAFSDIIAKTIEQMCQKGADINHIQAAIGPAIHQKSYEVDLAFKQRFLKKSGQNEQFFKDSERKNHYLFDLPAYGAFCLAQTGVKHIQPSLWDSCAEPKRFFSHRYATLHQKPQTGRLTAAICLKG